MAIIVQLSYTERAHCAHQSGPEAAQYNPIRI